jgi:hypothetical protein
MKTLKEIEAITDINHYLTSVNIHTQNEAKRCRILLARVLRELDKLNEKLK